jgi:hypothetical protein
MEKVSRRKQVVLDAIEEQIAELEELLAKAQPKINELNSLKASRRALLAERGVTGGGGNPNTQLSMEEVIAWMRENESGTPQEIAEALSVDGTIVRSHLSRGKGTRYQRDEETGEWSLIGEEDEEE